METNMLLVNEPKLNLGGRFDKSSWRYINTTIRTQLPHASIPRHMTAKLKIRIAYRRPGLWSRNRLLADLYVGNPHAANRDFNLVMRHIWGRGRGRCRGRLFHKGDNRNRVGRCNQLAWLKHLVQKSSSTIFWPKCYNWEWRRALCRQQYSQATNIHARTHTQVWRLQERWWISSQKDRLCYLNLVGRDGS